MDLTVLIEPKLDLERLSEVLDGLGHEGRVHCVRGWDKKTQASIYAACEGFRAITLDHFVPPSIGTLTEVIHEGKNSLPAFSHFQKRFCKPSDGSSDKLWGFNFQPVEWLGPVIGPGYFITRVSERAGEVAIDYRELPTEKCAGWPEIEKNDGKNGLVYGGMVDHMRGISKNVSIGRAERGGKMMDAYFVLVRLDLS